MSKSREIGIKLGPLMFNSTFSNNLNYLCSPHLNFWLFKHRGLDSQITNGSTKIDGRISIGL
jgi:hypothetical protein